MDPRVERMFSKAREDDTCLDEAGVREIVATLNHAMLGNVEGPCCIEPGTCADNCCSIMIDIPDVLARRYIETGLLGASEVRRGDVFAWKLATSEATGRCVFFDPSTRGCTIYVQDLEARPPQCAVYPAGYETGAATCKGGAGPWRVKEARTGQACKELMDAYAAWCIAERRDVQADLASGVGQRVQACVARVVDNSPPRPSAIAGLTDTWEGFILLQAEGTSLSFKRFCTGCPTPFLACAAACTVALDRFSAFMTDRIEACLDEPGGDGMRETYTILTWQSPARPGAPRDPRHDDQHPCT